VNRQFEKQFGLSRSAVLGKTDREIFEPAQAAVFMANDQEAARGPGTFEESAVYADGPHMSIVSKFPVLDSSGKTRGVGGIATDITEIRRAQEKILEQASLLEKARDAIIVRNLDHRITYWNNSAQRLYGWTADEAVGRIATELIYRDTESFSQAHEQMMRTGEWVSEARQVSRQGAELVVDSRWTLVRDEKGQPRSILTINTDITEKRKLEQQFLRAQRLESIGTLAGGIAHDLNNVLTPILLTAELLQSTETSPRARDLLERIKRSAERGADMVNQVLTFARGAEGKRAALRAEDIIKDVGKIVRDTFPRYIEVALDVEPGLPFIYGEPTQLHQVLLNLCVNARDAIGGNGKISITARKTPTPDSHKSSEFPDGWIRIDVEDTGNGIPPENLDKVFDPFFTTKETGAGTGLGLSTSQTIVKDHGGTIEVESRPGHTRFSVYLPAQIKGHTTGLPASRELPPGNGETVLLTEDEAMIRDIIAQTLASSGYQPIFASNGAEAVERVAREGAGIQAVIVDMMMPVMNGPEAIREMIQRQPGIKIIACSGIPANESIALAAGASAFMAKPYSTETLLCKLHELLHPG
jgi:PAS domain S-box-containing protein